MVIDARAVAGYVVAWMIRRARRAAGPVDTAIDAGLDELHRVVAAKLDASPALAAARAEAVEGNQVADPTRQRVAAAAVRADDPFGQAVTRLVARVRELRRLLRGSEVERHLLGLLTAARGGLSGTDLRELTRAGLVDIEDVLHGVAGRTFARRAADWSEDVEIYLLGHEELFREAVRHLGDERLAGYRDQLHAWADKYRAWPASTPEYLLTGYPRMLAAAGDTERLLALATDPVRHERLLDMSGGDVAALNEITLCQDLFRKRPEIDLFGLALLAHHRTEIEVRNANLPPSLPAVWALLGWPTRAETLAHSIRTRSEHRAMALNEVAVAVASTGDFARAERIATGIAAGYWRSSIGELAGLHPGLIVPFLERVLPAAHTS